MTDEAHLLNVLWSAGDLSYLLHSGQEEARSAYYAHDAKLWVDLCSRRWGKSWKDCTMWVEQAVSKSESRWLYGTPTQKMARHIAEPHIKKILQDCPDHLKPRFWRQDGIWEFPNKSSIVLAGCDNGGAERLRGAEADGFCLDEAGFIDDLEYVVQDILMPQTLTTGGRGLLSSTPPRSPEHPFAKKYVPEALARGALHRATIYDAPHIPPDVIERYMEECGGEESTTWIREYLARIVVDETRAVIPEFQRLQKDLVVELDAPEWMDRYVFADVGFNDLTVVGFWEWHFIQSKFYQRDELVFENKGTADIAPAVLEKERELWGDADVYQRRADAPPMTRADLAHYHGQSWADVDNRDPESLVNKLRLACVRKQLAWHPRCRVTIAHMGAAIWNKSRSSFERSGEFGHFDGVAQCMYANHHHNRQRNPYPNMPHGVSRATHYIPPEGPSGAGEALTSLIRGPR